MTLNFICSVVNRTITQELGFCREQDAARRRRFV